MRRSVKIVLVDFVYPLEQRTLEIPALKFVRARHGDHFERTKKEFVICMRTPFGVRDGHRITPPAPPE